MLDLSVSQPPCVRQLDNIVNVVVGPRGLLILSSQNLFLKLPVVLLGTGHVAILR